jgi:hypothetical protein
MFRLQQKHVLFHDIFIYDGTAANETLTSYSEW